MGPKIAFRSDRKQPGVKLIKQTITLDPYTEEMDLVGDKEFTFKLQ